MPSPNQPEFWNIRYTRDEMPWDFGGVPVDAKSFLRRNKLKKGRVLIPGCGSGYEIKAFADAGWDVTAIDFSLKAIERARQIVGPELAKNIIQGDFFTYALPAGTFDLVYERTFLCAITPDLREAYRDRVFKLLKPAGSLVGYFYYQNPDLDAGPPYGFAWGTSDELFGRHFILTKDIPVNDSLPIFAGRERWQEQRRTSFAG